MIWMGLLLLQIRIDPSEVVRGADVYARNCATPYCHGAKGAAGRAPQLAGRPYERFLLSAVVTNGISRTAMPGFQNQLKLEEIEAVVSYIISLGKAAPPASAPKPAAPKPGPRPPDVERGRELFFDGNRLAACAACHELEGWGVAIGPAPDREGGRFATFSIVRSTARGKLVQTAEAKGENPFPALPMEQTTEATRVYDLTVAPPVIRSFAPGDIRLREGAAWTHAAATRAYSDAEIESILSYVRWLAQ